MAAVADAVRRGAQRAANFFTKMCSFGLIQIFRPRSRPIQIFLVRSEYILFGRLVALPTLFSKDQLSDKLHQARLQP
jgi:hypothetical protein